MSIFQVDINLPEASSSCGGAHFVQDSIGMADVCVGSENGHVPDSAACTLPYIACVLMRETRSTMPLGPMLAFIKSDAEVVKIPTGSFVRSFQRYDRFLTARRQTVVNYEEALFLYTIHQRLFHDNDQKLSIHLYINTNVDHLVTGARRELNLGFSFPISADQTYYVDEELKHSRMFYPANNDEMQKWLKNDPLARYGMLYAVDNRRTYNWHGPLALIYLYLYTIYVSHGFKSSARLDGYRMDVDSLRARIRHYLAADAIKGKVSMRYDLLTLLLRDSNNGRITWRSWCMEHNLLIVPTVSPIAVRDRYLDAQHCPICPLSHFSRYLHSFDAAQLEEVKPNMMPDPSCLLIKAGSLMFVKLSVSLQLGSIDHVFYGVVDLRGTTSGSFWPIQHDEPLRLFGEYSCSMTAISVEKRIYRSEVLFSDARVIFFTDDLVKFHPALRFVRQPDHESDLIYEHGAYNFKYANAYDTIAYANFRRVSTLNYQQPSVLIMPTRIPELFSRCGTIGKMLWALGAYLEGVADRDWCRALGWPSLSLNKTNLTLTEYVISLTKHQDENIRLGMLYYISRFNKIKDGKTVIEDAFLPLVLGQYSSLNVLWGVDTSDSVGRILKGSCLKNTNHGAWIRDVNQVRELFARGYPVWYRDGLQRHLSMLHEVGCCADPSKMFIVKSSRTSTNYVTQKRAGRVHLPHPDPLSAPEDSSALVVHYPAPKPYASLVIMDEEHPYVQLLIAESQFPDDPVLRKAVLSSPHFWPLGRTILERRAKCAALRVLLRGTPYANQSRTISGYCYSPHLAVCPSFPVEVTTIDFLSEIPSFGSVAIPDECEFVDDSGLIDIAKYADMIHSSPELSFFFTGIPNATVSKLMSAHNVPVVSEPVYFMDSHTQIDVPFPDPTFFVSKEVLASASHGHFDALASIVPILTEPQPYVHTSFKSHTSHVPQRQLPKLPLASNVTNDSQSSPSMSVSQPLAAPVSKRQSRRATLGAKSAWVAPQP